jgi:mRNA export factor
MDIIANKNPVQTDYPKLDEFKDTIQAIKFNPSLQNDLLAGCSWDKTLKVWKITYDSIIQNTHPLVQSYESNLISLCWMPDQAVITGAANGSIYMFDVGGQQSYEIGKHEIGVSSVCYLNEAKLLISAGWDGYLKFWDFKSNQPCYQIDLGNRITTMSMSSPLLVVGMQNRQICYFDLTKMSGTNFTYTALYNSPLKQETKVITTFPDGKGYVIGGYESKIAVQHVELNAYPDVRNGLLHHPKDYIFNAHYSDYSSYGSSTTSKQTHAFPINDIAFNYKYETFCTAGGDGSWVIRDKDNKSVLRAGFYSDRVPITAVDYNWRGDVLAYACGNDWNKAGGKYERALNTFVIKLRLLDTTDKLPKTK